MGKSVKKLPKGSKGGPSQGSAKRFVTLNIAASKFVEVKHQKELQLVVKRFVTLNIAALLSSKLPIETASEIVTGAFDRVVNEALTDLVATLQAITDIGHA